MFGDSDQIYVLARQVLLDAFEALGDQSDAIILVGAQAIYLHTGDTDLADPPFTTDGDVAINPAQLKGDPRLAEVLRYAGFEADLQQVGTWITSRELESSRIEVKIDLLVPQAVSGDGTRGARLGVHGNRAARKVRGLEATLVDQQVMQIRALDAEDPRAFEVAVAGPAALLVAKLHKIAERIDNPRRSRDKDALDIFRLLQATPTQELVNRLRTILADERAAKVSEEALTLLRELFSEPSLPGCQMAARATLLDSPETIAASCAYLTQDLLRDLSL